MPIIERPPCPKCGGRLDFVRKYIGIESRGIQALKQTGQGTWRVTVDDEVASDEYDEITEERVFCLEQGCDFSVSGDGASGLEVI
jgi:hypothetical protein